MLNHSETLEPKPVLDNALRDLRTAIGDYEVVKIDSTGLYCSVLNIWSDLAGNIEVYTKIEDAMAEKRRMMGQIAPIDLSMGDPVRQRYDPLNWVKNIPDDNSVHPGAFILDRSKSLLSLLEGIQL